LKCTSDFSTSIVLSLAAGPNRSISAPLLSKVHIETRLLVTLCCADWTFQSPTGKDGVNGVGAVSEAPLTLAVPGVEGLLD